MADYDDPISDKEKVMEYVYFFSEKVIYGWSIGINESLRFHNL